MPSIAPAKPKSDHLKELHQLLAIRLGLPGLDQPGELVGAGGLFGHVGQLGLAAEGPELDDGTT